MGRVGVRGGGMSMGEFMGRKRGAASLCLNVKRLFCFVFLVGEEDSIMERFLRVTVGGSGGA